GCILPQQLPKCPLARPRRGDAAGQAVCYRRSMNRVPHPIPFFRLSGTHREVGRQVGEACAEDIRASLDFDAELPEGRTREQQLELARPYWEVTAAALPWLAEEYEGAAEAVGVPLLDFFAASIEEIWY